MKVCLPVVTPPITSQAYVANLLSILWVHKDSTLPWICNKYLQLVVIPNNLWITCSFYDELGFENGVRYQFFCPFVEWRSTHLQNNFPPEVRLSDYIEHQIDNGFYLDTPLDCFYLSCSPSYQKRHFLHQTFINGYDKENQLIYVSDFYQNAKYTRTTVTYDEINSSYAECKILLYQYKTPNYDYTFNIDFLRLVIEDYLLCRDSFSRHRFADDPGYKNTLYGLDFYDYLPSVMNKRYPIDIRPYHVLYDHKQLMKIRIEYLYSIGIINKEQKEQLDQENNVLIKKSLILRNMVLKYDIAKNDRLINRIDMRCVELRELDRQLFEKLLLLL